MSNSCWSCGGDGGFHDCGEDTCCCLDPEDEGSEFWVTCDVCGGAGELPEEDGEYLGLDDEMMAHGSGAS